MAKAIGLAPASSAVTPSLSKYRSSGTKVKWVKKSRRVTSFSPGFLPEPAHLVADSVDGEGDEVEYH